MKVYVKGQNQAIDLDNNSFFASGGFGNCYRKGGLVYKIYQKPKDIIPEAKIQELSVLTHKNIIKPQNLVLDTKNKAIGYTMKEVVDSYTLCQIFPKPFRTRNNFNADNALHLVRNMQETIASVHAHKVLIVDLNEMNFLVDKSFKEVYFIDVDSYQTQNFPANAIMESVRDRHATRFSELTDWFSFAIVSYQLFRGIHPYKGKHDRYTSLDDRMLHNISVMNKNVSFPQGAVLPESVIPDTYRNWYKAVLEKGERLKPPTDIVAVIHIVQPQIRKISGKSLDFIPLQLFSREVLIGEPLAIYTSGQLRILLTNQMIYNEGTRFQCASHGNVCIGFTSRQNQPVAAHIDDDKIKFVGINRGEQIPFQLEAETMMETEGRIYYKIGRSLMEVSFSDQLRPLNHQVMTVMPQSTELYPGCVIQNMLGSFFINIFPESRQTIQFHLKEIKGYKIIEAKYENGVCILIGTKAGKYSRFVFRFDLTRGEYDVRLVADIDNTGLNFVVLPQSVCVASVENGHIEIFSNKIGNDQLKVLTDDSMSGTKLLKDGSKIVIYQNSEFLQVKTK